MINKKRIVPIVKMDLLSMIGTIMKIANVSFSALAVVDGKATATGTGSVGNFLADEPVKTIDFASGVTAGTVYFIADYDFAGITVAGAAATIASGSKTVDAAGANLYAAALSSGEVTISEITPVA